AGAAAAVLGPGIFSRYLHGLGALQEHLGRGVPGAMLNLRGLLVRLLGTSRAPAATALAFAACGGAALAFWLAWRGDAGRERLRRAYALACAAALFFSPHLFVGDLTLWAAPLGLGAAALGDASPTARSFRRFALAWPLAIAATIAVDPWPRLFFET